MAGSLTLKTAQLVQWRMERPLLREKIESPIFSFLNEEWRLVIDFKFEECCLTLKKVAQCRDFQPFDVTTWFEDEGQPTIHLNCVNETVATDNQYIWGIYEMKLREEMSKCEDDNRFTFVCLLHVADEELEHQVPHSSSGKTKEPRGGSPSKRRKVILSK